MLDTFSVVGSGSLGGVLSHSLAGIGMRCEQIVSRTQGSAERVTSSSNAENATTLDEAAFGAGSLVLIAVPDDAIEEVSVRLASNSRSDWNESIVLHTSGALNNRVLGALEAKGAETGSFHPLQTFTGKESKGAFEGITIGIEGTERAVQTARHLADALLAQPVEIDSDKKTLYHAAAVMAGNHLISMLAAAEEMWEQSVGSRDSFSEAVGPLSRSSVSNAIQFGPDAALTGPVVRGDAGTLRKHLQAVLGHTPHLISLYGSIATETVHLAVRSGRLPADTAVQLLDVIASFLNAPEAD